MSIKNYIKKENVLFLLILIIQVSIMAGYGNMKKGYFVDELWSYGLANSYYHPHVYSDGKLDDWVEGKYFKDYIEVLDDQRFQYGSVVYNQKNDVHPPLFYIVLHTICSFFPNSFSKWYGIFPNIFYFSCCMYFLYKLGYLLFDNSYRALIPVMAYGLCPGSISNVMYIRMYMLLTVWAVYAFYIHSRWIKTGGMNVKGLIELVAVSYLGFMSHYYYFVYAFFLSAFYVIYLIKKEDMKKTIQYCLAMAGSLFLVLITYPTAYKQLFWGDRGKEAVGNFFKIDAFLDSFRNFYLIMTEGVFANCNVLLAIGFIGIIFIGKDMILKKETRSKQFYIIMMAMVTIWAYFIVVVKIAPYRVDRYLFCIYPLISLIISYALFCILIQFNISLTWSHVGVLLVFLLIVVKGVSENKIQYLYSDMWQNIELAKRHAGDDCIYITRDYYKLVGSALELENMGRVRGLIPDELYRLPEIIDMSAEEMIVYVDETYDQKEIMNLFCSNGGFKSYRYLLTSRCNAYVVSK